jgi:hypothetical protein
MVQTILSFLLVSFMCLIWGLPFFTYPAYRNKICAFTTEHLLLSFFCGLAAISILGSWISLFLRVTIVILIGLTVPLLFLTIRSQKKIKWEVDFKFFHKNTLIENCFLFACLLLFSFLAVGAPTMEDSDLYHIQTINWIHNYGTVPGLANLYLRYGLSSNWFHAISIFQLPFTLQNFLYLNHSFAIWLFLFLFYQFKKNRLNNTKASAHLSLYYFSILLFMLFEWDLFRVAASSTSYDFVITGTTLICLHYLIEWFLSRHQAVDKKNAIIFLVVSAPFFKMTGILIIPLIFFFVTAGSKISVLLKALGVGVIGAIPVLAKNFIQTGYALFPYQIGDVFQPSWKIPGEMVIRFNRYIYLGNHYINQEIPKTAWQDNSSFSYYRDWFLHLVTLDKMIIFASLISLPVAFTSMRKIYGSELKKIIALYLISMISILFWFLESPDLRFCFGLLLFIVFFPFTAPLARFVGTRVYPVAMFFFILGIGYYLYQKIPKTFKAENLLQVTKAPVPPFKKQLINQQAYNIPEIINNNWNSRCLDCPLPCVYQINPYLHLRGKEINNGFKMSPYPDSGFILNYRY